MITARKYLNLDLSVINISAYVLEKLAVDKRVTYIELENYLKNMLGEKSLENFPYAISFLFLTNKLAYISELDIIELNEAEQNILK